MKRETLLQELPDIKLSYENIIHKTVTHFDVIFAIPKGKKCLAWFLEWDQKYICMLLELQSHNGMVGNIIVHKKDIIDITIVNSCFSKQLCYGTILYGTLFEHMQTSFFTVEDVHYYKGKNVSRENWKDKMNTIVHILKHETKQVSYNQHFTIFGLPIISNSHQ